MRKESFIGLITGFVLLVTFFLPGIQSSMAYEKQIQSLSAFMAGKIATAGKKSIAVVDFTDLQGNVTELGRFLAEEFSVALAGASKGFEVIDRTHLKSIMAEHKLASKGIIDPQTARKLGKIAGVGALITGTITPFGDSIRLSVKVLDTETAKMISASTGNIAKTDAIEELLARGIELQKGPSTRIDTSAPAPEEAKQTIEVNNFVFKLQRCKVTGQTVIFSLLITNKEKDRKLRSYPTTRIFDNSGREYKAERAQLGNKTGKSDYYGVEKILISGIPTSASFTFKGVSPQPKSITVLEIHCKARDRFKIQFRNIPLPTS